MRVFAIGDLHLPGSQGKPMDVFGAHWERHFEKICEDWRARVLPEDVVLLPGDLSWAMTLEEAAQDIAAICALPGQKLLLRGNHDYWWSSLTRTARPAAGGKLRPAERRPGSAGHRLCRNARLDHRHARLQRAGSQDLPARSAAPGALPAGRRAQGPGAPHRGDAAHVRSRPRAGLLRGRLRGRSVNSRKRLAPRLIARRIFRARIRHKRCCRAGPLRSTINLNTIL